MNIELTLAIGKPWASRNRSAPKLVVRVWGDTVIYADFTGYGERTQFGRWALLSPHRSGS